MHLSQTDRNRIRVATVITSIVLPVLFLVGGGSGASSESTVPQAPTTTYDDGLSTGATEDAPANAEGPSSNGPNGQGQVAYPATNDGRMIRGNASYKQFPIGDGQACTSNSIPLGAVVSVMNLNNGRKVKCTNINSVYVPPGFDIVLNMQVFTTIADLIDAPLAVELTW